MKTSTFKPIKIVLLAYLTIPGFLLQAQDEFLSEEELYEEEVATIAQISDPLEPVNRVIYHFNDFLYLNILGPIADGYQLITPDPIEKSATNFFRNIRYPIRLVGNLLQGRIKGARIETERFLINSTIGIGGLLSPADQVEDLAPIPAEDIAQAFGTWGIPEGLYLVLPVFGASSVRDAVGLFFDFAAHPTSEPYSLIDDWNWEWRTAWTGSEILVETPSLLEAYRQMKGVSFDPYGSLKNAYTQRQRAKIEE